MNLVIPRFLAAQMIYVNVFVLFIQVVSHGGDNCALITTLQVMASSGERDHHTSPSNPHTYAKIVGKISFFLGFWALFVFFKVS